MPKVHKVTEEEISSLMTSKGISRFEAESLIIDKYDEVIFPDEADNINDTLKEQRKVAHVYDKKKGNVKRERKPNETKRELIKVLEDTFGNEDGFKVVNIEREVSFNRNGKNYSIVLTEHRNK